jgi:outer membrane usher protein FimD/PapC
MSSKKVLILTISTCLLLSFIGCGEKSKENRLTLLSKTNITYNTSLISNTIKDLSVVSNTNEEEKIEIARTLFDKYINENKTDWKRVEFQNLERKPEATLTDYRINNIKVTGEEKNKFIVSIEYDIKYTNESDMWIAGNGKVCEDNWIRNKSNFVEIQKNDDEYVITNIITG